jgi:hypothetical protein
MKFINIFKAMFVKGQLVVMLKKIWLRFFDKKNRLSQDENLSWLSRESTNMSEFCMGLNESLWNDIQSDVERVCSDAKKRLEDIPFELGGGGAYPLLYFIVRLCKPKVVVETGVASGFSTYAILDALNKNETGHLYSSDFPYFRLSNPAQFIGIVVPENLKKRWSLYIKGDAVNLPEINREILNIDIFHYDSDKSYSGRVAAQKIFNDKITNKSWVIIDDIQDNCFFHDFVSENNYKNWQVFEFEGKWVGVVCPE